jgi:hypothetical protein
MHPEAVSSVLLNTPTYPDRKPVNLRIVVGIPRTQVERERVRVSPLAATSSFILVIKPHLSSTPTPTKSFYGRRHLHTTDVKDFYLNTSS